MTTEQFLLEDKIKEIQATYSKNGWIVLYESTRDEDYSFLVYPCLVAGNKVKGYKTGSKWMVEPGYEGRPSVFSGYSNEKDRASYHSYSDKGVEPFIYFRRFWFASVD